MEVTYAVSLYYVFAAFDGIIRCAELRLNNILNMNDASEMRLFMNGICRAVTEKLDLENEREKSREVTAFFQKELEEEFHYSAYAACFSGTGMTLLNGSGTATWVRAYVLPFHESLMQKMVGGVISLQKVYYQKDMRGHHLVTNSMKPLKNSATFAGCFPRLQNLMNEAWVQSPPSSILPLGVKRKCGWWSPLLFPANSR